MAQHLCQSIAVRRAARLLLTLTATFALLSAQQTTLEYRVKAAFLLNFTRFIDWPPEAAAAGAPFTICILGDDPFGAALDQTVEGEMVNGQRIVVQSSRREFGKACQILYVDKAEKGAPEILTTVGRGVLTVGEGEKFLRDGGMIAFVLDNRRVRFSVNLTAARNASLRFSSKLLSVAKEVVQ